MADGQPAALSLAGVTRSFGGLTAVYGLLGPNGAGKTTLFNLISGETLSDAGEIRLFGRDVTRLAPHRRAALGMARTYQITNLFPRLSAFDNCVLVAQALSPV